MDDTLKQKFAVLLEYQKKDIELRKLTAVIDRDEALVHMNKNRRIFNEAKQTMADCDGAAGTILDQYNTLVKYVEENEALLAELEKAAEGDDADIETRVKRLESLKSKFQNAEKRMHDISDKAKSTCKRRADALKAGKNAQQLHNDAREKHMALIKSKEAELNKLKAELAALAKKLDPKLFEEYKALVAEGKFPPVVYAVGGEKNMYNCSGCGLSLPQNNNAMLGNQGWCRCENCRRMIIMRT